MEVLFHLLRLGINSFMFDKSIYIVTLRKLKTAIMAKKYWMAMVCCATILSVNAQFVDGFEWAAGGVCPSHWANGPGATPFCPIIGNVGAHSGTYLALMGADPASDDYLLYMGNRVSGEAGIEFYAYIPSGKEAYVSLQGTLPTTIGEWLVGNIFFNEALGSPGEGVIDFASNDPNDWALFNFPHDEWFRIVMNFDMTGGMANATWSMSVANEIIVSEGTPFTNAAGDIPSSLGGLNFYAISVDAELYTDDFNYIIDGQLELRLGLEDQFLNTTKVFPNPVSDVLTIDSSIPIDSITVYDLKGTIVLHAQNSLELDMASLITGVYFVEIRSENAKMVKRVIKK